MIKCHHPGNHSFFPPPSAYSLPHKNSTTILQLSVIARWMRCLKNIILTNLYVLPKQWVVLTEIYILVQAAVKWNLRPLALLDMRPSLVLFSFFCFPHLVSMVLRLQCFSHWIGNFTPIPTTTLPPKAHPAVLTPPSPPFPCPYMQALQLVKLPKPWAIVISEEAAEWYFDGRVEGGGESRIEKNRKKRQ